MEFILDDIFGYIQKNNYKLEQHFKDLLIKLIHWDRKTIYENPSLNQKFIDLFHDYIDWNLFLIHKKFKLTDAFIKKYKNKVQDFNWFVVSEQMDDEDLFKFMEYIQWNDPAPYYLMSENFIKTYPNIIHWQTLCSVRELSEELIDQFSDKVHWPSVLQLKDNLSDGFKSKYKHIIEKINVNDSFLILHLLSSKFPPYLTSNHILFQFWYSIQFH